MDAAICLPVFLLAIGLIMCLMMEIEAEEQAFHRLCASAVSDMQLEGAVHRLGIGGFFVDGVREKSKKVSVKIPNIGSGKRTDALEYIVYRPFIGAEESEEADDTRVYVFPKRGQRYHIRSCIILREGAVETVLSKALRKKYSSCKICKPGSLKNGALVYMFSEGSSVYHRKHCASISKAFVSMGLSEARREGYTPCMLCFGGGDE